VASSTHVEVCVHLSHPLPTFEISSPHKLCRLSESNEQQVVQQTEGHAVELSWHPTQPVCLAAMGSHLVLLQLET
jgi:hypothetical protein